MVAAFRVMFREIAVFVIIYAVITAGFAGLFIAWFGEHDELPCVDE